MLFVTDYLVMNDKKLKKKPIAKQWTLSFRKDSEYQRLLNNPDFMIIVKEKNYVSNDEIFAVIWKIKLDKRYL